MNLSGGGFTWPGTAAGDMVVGGAGGSPGRFPAGADGTVLAVVAGVVQWFPIDGSIVWPLAANVDQGFQPTAIANSALTLHNNANAVNGLTITGTAAGADVLVRATGADVNRGIFLQSKGSGAMTMMAGSFQAVLSGTTGNLSLPGGSIDFRNPGLQLSGPSIIAFRPEGIANDALIVDNAPTAVNGLTATGAATGAAPSIAATGNDVNIGLNLVTKGTGALLVNGAPGAAGQVLTSNGPTASPTWSSTTIAFPLTNGADEGFRPSGVANNALTLHNNASAVNGLTITGTAAGSDVLLQVTGNDVNRGMQLQSKGSGTLTLTAGSFNAALSGTTGSLSLPGGAIAFRNPGLAITATSIITFRPEGITNDALIVDAAGSSVNGVTVTAAATGGPPRIAATGNDANIDLTLAGQGTGIVNFGYATTALGAGATPTLGTIGGSGPAAAAQNCWVAVKVNGTTTFLPGWR